MITVPAKMGYIDKRDLLSRLHRLGQATRAELAKSRGLSRPTAGKIADELLRMGWGAASAAFVSFSVPRHAAEMEQTTNRRG